MVRFKGRLIFSFPMGACLSALVTTSENPKLLMEHFMITVLWYMVKEKVARIGSILEEVTAFTENL